MRKTSQDGGDSTSITSGLGIMKSTRNSIKRKVQSLSHESDDAVIEPLLQKDKENCIPVAKFSLGKTKTDQTSDKGKDNQAFKVNLTDIKLSSAACSTKISDAPSGADYYKNAYSSVPPYRAFVPSTLEPVSEQILVNIDGSKIAERANSPLIFTTAKIHADTNPNQTEQVRVTPSSLSKTELFDSKPTINLHNNDKTFIENDKAINEKQDVSKLGGLVSENIISDFFQNSTTTLETKTLDANTPKGLTTSTNLIANTLRDSINTTKGETTIKVDLSDSKLENNQVQVNAKLENVSLERKKTENKSERNIHRNDFDGIDINKNIQSKAMASMGLEGTTTTKALLAEKKVDKPLQRQKSSSIEGSESAKTNSCISSANTAVPLANSSDDPKNTFKLPSLNKMSFDDKASTTKPVTCSVNTQGNSKPTVTSSATNRSSTKTINVSAVSKTPSTNPVKPLGSLKAVTSTAIPSTTSSVAKVSTVTTIHNAGQSGTQSKVGNKESSTKASVSKLNTENEREKNVVTHKT